MRKYRWLPACLLLAGCGGGNPVAGTYRNPTGAEIILNSDGTYRYMIGERTSPRDILGTYTVSGARITFGGAQNRFKEATVSSGLLSIGDGTGGTSDFRKG